MRDTSEEKEKKTKIDGKTKNEPTTKEERNNSESRKKKNEDAFNCKETDEEKKEGKLSREKK
jgi:hypothetical protein